MVPVTSSNKKKDLETPISRAQSDSARGVKIFSEEGEIEKIEESYSEKRRRPAEKENIRPLEYVEEEYQQKEEQTEKEMDEGQEEASDSSHPETFYMDLPDDCLRHIFSYLDLPSRLKLRVNKRLDQLQLSVKNKMNRITLKVKRTTCRLVMSNYTPLQSPTLTQWENGLRLLTLNTFVDTIWIIPHVDPSEKRYRIIDALFHFNANKLIIEDTVDYDLSRVTLPSLLTLAQNVKEVDIGLICTSLSSNDLCTIRKTMLEGDCTMKSFKVRLGHNKKKSFWEECFGVTISDCLGSLHGTTFQAADDSLEMFRKYTWWWNTDLDNFEGNLRTWTDYHGIYFKKLDVVVKPHDSFKIKWNHLYRDS